MSVKTGEPVPLNTLKPGESALNNHGPNAVIVVKIDVSITTEYVTLVSVLSEVRNEPNCPVASDQSDFDAAMADAARKLADAEARYEDLRVEHARVLELGHLISSLIYAMPVEHDAKCSCLMQNGAGTCDCWLQLRPRVMNALRDLAQFAMK